MALQVSEMGFYIKPSDIGVKIGDTRVVTINTAEFRNVTGFNQELMSKLCLTFKELPRKTLVLSKAQSESLKAMYSSVLSDWVGIKLNLAISVNTKGNLIVVPQIHIKYLFTEAYNL